MKNVDPCIGERVMLSRRRKHLSQQDLAAQVAMSPTSINRLERGLQSVSAESLMHIARALSVSADFLLGLQEEEAMLHKTAP